MDVVKGIGITLMVIGHSSAPNVIINFIYSFHIPMFFIIAGYLMNYKKWKNKYKLFVKRKTERLLFPYFFMSIFVFYPLWFIATNYFSKYGTHDIDSPQNVFVDIFYATFIGDGMAFNSPLWFLPCLFIAEVIFLGVLIISEKTYIRYVIVCALVAIGYYTKWMNLPWSLDIALVVQLFLLLGYLIKNADINKGNSAVSLLILLIICNVNNVDVAHRRYGNIIYCYISGIFGTLFVLKISDIICKNINIIARILACLGRESMAVLMWHGWNIKLISAVLAYCLNMTFLDAKTLLWPVIVLGAIMLSLVILIVKNKIRDRLCDYPTISKCISW